MKEFVVFAVWAACLQGLFLSGLYFFSQKYRSLSNKILGLFLLCLIIEAVNSFFPYDCIGEYSIRDYFGLPEVKLFLPVLFFHYVVKKIGVYPKYASIIKVVYAFAICVACITILNIFFFFSFHQSLMEVFSIEFVDTIFMSQQTIAWFLSIMVLIISIVELLIYRHTVQREYSDIALLHINWLWQFVLLIAPVLLLWGLELLRIALDTESYSTFVYVNWGILTIIIYFVTYKAFVQRDLFENPQEQRISKHSQALEAPKISSHTAQILTKLEDFMEKEKPFLKSDLTLHNLAQDTGIPPRKISQCINQYHNTNFSVWVNRYRVEAAIELLRDFSFNNRSIEGIGQESGFKSRSSLYLAFKKIKGKSPGDYKV